MLIPRITESLTVDDMEELAAYLAHKLARRLPEGVWANEVQMATLVTGYMRDWLEAREGEISIQTQDALEMHKIFVEGRY
jgi:hypothetical protein